jgi:hypothetical protein
LLEREQPGGEPLPGMPGPFGQFKTDLSWRMGTIGECASPGWTLLPGRQAVDLKEFVIQVKKFHLGLRI